MYYWTAISSRSQPLFLVDSSRLLKTRPAGHHIIPGLFSYLQYTTYLLTYSSKTCFLHFDGYLSTMYLYVSYCWINFQPVHACMNDSNYLKKSRGKKKFREITNQFHKNYFWIFPIKIKKCQTISSFLTTFIS